MTSTLHQMCKELKKCTEILEKDVKNSLDQLSATNFNESAIALESSKDYHYKEILDQLRQIKDHVKVIADHTQCIQSLENKIQSVKIDKNYIKKQVESFQKLGLVNRREHKPVRPPETSSMKLLECWEKMLEEQEEKRESVEIPPVRRRPTKLRKKVVSSTVETFLENLSIENAVFDLSEEEADVTKVDVAHTVSDDGKLDPINEEENSETKPRIVEVIYKKKINGHVPTEIN